MKKILSILSVFSLVLMLFSGCGSSTDTLNVYIWGEFISDGSDGSENVKKLFEKEYGVKVNISNFASNEEMYAKIKSGSASYDLIVPSDYMIARMIDEDMLEKINFNNVPNFSKIMPSLKNPNYDPNNEYSVPYLWGMVGLIYNRSNVSSDVDSWDALWSESYKNQILMFNNPRDAFGIALKYLGYSQNTTDKLEIDKAAELLKKQNPLIQSYVMDEIYDKMGNNEAFIAPYYSGDAYVMIRDNPDLKFIVPKEGTNLFVDAMVIPKGANKELAEKFINFLTSPDIGKLNAEYTNASTPIVDVYDQLDDGIKNDSNLYPSPEFISQNTESFIYLPKEINTYIDDLWLEIKVGK